MLTTCPDFKPTELYRTLYQKIWRDSAKALHLPAEKVHEFEKLFDRHDSREMKAEPEAHHRIVVSFGDRWRSYRNNSTCLMCVIRRPEYGLPCSHMLCEDDIDV